MEFHANKNLFEEEYVLDRQLNIYGCKFIFTVQNSTDKISLSEIYIYRKYAQFQY
jgi:hypothetical protein